MVYRVAENPERISHVIYPPQLIRNACLALLCVTCLSSNAIADTEAPEPPGEWLVEEGIATLFVTAPSQPVAVRYRLSIGGRSVIWTDGWVNDETSVVADLRVPNSAITHPAMPEHTLMLHTRLETPGGKFALRPLPVRVVPGEGDWAVVAVVPEVRSADETDPTLVHNRQRRIVPWNDDLMAQVPTVVVETPTENGLSGGAL